jgi:putative ABC transport system ATP-binding protein
MTAWENVSVGLVPLGVPEKERFLRARTLLERLGLNERIHHRPEELSGGEQQRVSFARALIHEPELILADEPTSNIDADSAERVLQILADLKSRGCTIAVASHDAEIFKRTGVDALFRLAKGRTEN